MKTKLLALFLIFSCLAHAQSTWDYKVTTNGPTLFLDDTVHNVHASYPTCGLYVFHNATTVYLYTLYTNTPVNKWVAGQNLGFLDTTVLTGYNLISGMIYSNCVNGLNETFIPWYDTGWVVTNRQMNDSLLRYILYTDTTLTIATKKNLQSYVKYSDTTATIYTVKAAQSKINYSDTLTKIASRRWVDSLIVHKVDTLYRHLDSIIYTINGTRHAIKDSAGSAVASGTNGAVQYSIGGVFTSNPAFHWNDTQLELFVSDSLGNGYITTNSLKLFNGQSSSNFTMLSYTGTNNIYYTLPDTEKAGVLADDGSGNLSWTTIGRDTIYIGGGGSQDTVITDTITSAQILNSYTSPDTLLPAPGVGWQWIGIAVSMQYDSVSTSYSFVGGGSSLFINDTIASICPWLLGPYLPTINFTQNFGMGNGLPQQNTRYNKPLTFYSPAGNPTGGNGFLTITIIARKTH